MEISNNIDKRKLQNPNSEKKEGKGDLRVGQPWRGPDPRAQVPIVWWVPTETHPTSNPFLASLSLFLTLSSLLTNVAEAAASNKQRFLLQGPKRRRIDVRTGSASSTVTTDEGNANGRKKGSPTHFCKAQVAHWSMRRARAYTWRVDQWLGWVKPKTHVMKVFALLLLILR